MVTLKQIASEIDKPEHQVLYAAKKLKLEPKQRAGAVRLYSRGVIRRIQRTIDGLQRHCRRRKDTASAA